jgi:hypothetical protein
MPLQKQTIPINFAKGLDTKTDPWQVDIGNFISLSNSVFTIGKRLTKRNGYQLLDKLPTPASFITTFNGDLTAIGTELQAYNEPNNLWVNKGNIIPVKIATTSLIKNNLNQSQCDTAIAANGLICTVYTEVGVNGLNSYKYAVADSVTGQNIVAPAVISAADSLFGTPRVFILGSYFAILFITKVSSNFFLQYFTISTANPTIITVPTNVSSVHVAAVDGTPWDAAIMNDTLYIAWATAAGVDVAYLPSSLSVSSAKAIDTSHGSQSYFSVCADQANSTIWVSYWSFGTSNAYAFAMNPQLTAILSPTEILTGSSLNQITSSAQGNVLTFIFDIVNTYGYDSAIASDYIQYVTCTISGTVGSPVTIKRSLGLASKSFIFDGEIYVLGVYQSPYQNTYFLTDISGDIVAKLAYGNAGGYYPTFIPSVSVIGTTASVGYLFKDLIQAVNKNTNVGSGNQTAGIYTQTGINVAAFEIGAPVVTVETGSNLNLTGGFLWAYDGFLPVEQNFFLWPDSIEVSSVTSVTPTGNSHSGTDQITNLSSMVNVAIGATITGTDIPANTTIIAVNVGASSITISNDATGTASGTTFTIDGQLIAQQYFYQVTYEWSDNQGNIFRSAPSIPVSITTTGSHSTVTIQVPTLRLTYKTANPIKIVAYRWSAAQQIYYQVTSLASPVLNDTTIDSVTIYDASSDSAILGNNILYTTGGVLEDIGPPGFNSIFTFDDRLWGIPSEDPNTTWNSKQIIEATPVEMSDLLTTFIAPGLSAQGPTGPLKCGAPMDDKVIFFKGSAIYYINGTGPDNTGENSQYSQPIFVTSMVGCSNQASIIFQPEGLMFEFASESGNQIWLLGRDLSTKYIGASVEGLTNGAVVNSAVAIPGTNQVRFHLSSGITLIYDYFYGEWGSFSTKAVSSTLYQGLHTYLGDNGGVYQETPGKYLDGTSPVLMSFTTAWINLAGIQGYERLYEFYLLGQYLSPHFLNIQLAYDYNPSIAQSKLINPRNFSPSAPSGFGVPTPFGAPINLEQWRIFPKKQLCQSFQLTVSEVFNPAFGTVAGPGLTVSGISMVAGIKRGYRPIRGANSVGIGSSGG